MAALTSRGLLILLLFALRSQDTLRANVPVNPFQLLLVFLRLVLCDGRGHLIDHLLDYPSHMKLYSYKLQRQVGMLCNMLKVMREIIRFFQGAFRNFDKEVNSERKII